MEANLSSVFRQSGKESIVWEERKKEMQVMRPIRILVVEDDEDFQHLIKTEHRRNDPPLKNKRRVIL